jgi:hypothetical protein
MMNRQPVDLRDGSLRLLRGTCPSQIICLPYRLTVCATLTNGIYALAHNARTYHQLIDVSIGLAEPTPYTRHDHPLSSIYKRPLLANKNGGPGEVDKFRFVLYRDFHRAPSFRKDASRRDLATVEPRLGMTGVRRYLRSATRLIRNCSSN